MFPSQLSEVQCIYVSMNVTRPESVVRLQTYVSGTVGQLWTRAVIDLFPLSIMVREYVI